MEAPSAQLVVVRGVDVTKQTLTTLNWDDLVYMFNAGLGLRHLSSETKARDEEKAQRTLGDAISLAPSFDYLASLLREQVVHTADIEHLTTKDPRMIFTPKVDLPPSERLKLIERFSSDVREWLKSSVIGASARSDEQTTYQATKMLDSGYREIFLSVVLGGSAARGARNLDRVAYPTGKLGSGGNYPIVAIIRNTEEAAELERVPGEELQPSLWAERILTIKWNALVEAIRHLRKGA